jgi:hypothetical protein
MTTSPTSFPEVNAILNILLPETKEILGGQFVGMYLHGSLAYGDFNPQTSDIDFLVVTDGPIPADAFSALKEMHARLFTSGLTWAQKIEGAYIPKKALRRHDPQADPVPWLGVDGHFALEPLGSDWTIQRWILREKGLVVAGPPLKPMIDPVSADDLREAVRDNLQGWWSPPIPSPERFDSNGYRAYAVLTMCRSLFVLEHGAIASKPAAARWAMETLTGPQVELIQAALFWKPGMKFNRWKEVEEFIHYTLRCWGINTTTG